MADDDEIIRLRENIRRAAEAKVENGTLTVTSDREGIVCRIAGESGFYGNVIRNLDAGRTYSIEVMLQENACYLASNLVTLTIEPEGSGGETRRGGARHAG